jgi:hypothetical protein
LKLHYSYLAIFAAVSFYAPPTYSESSQTSSQVAVNTVAIEPNTNPVEGISSFYSDMDMRVRLSVTPNEKVCSGDTCAENQAFDAKVQLIGESLAKSAYVLYPELKKNTPHFEFSVADKKVLGSASNAGGKVILFRGIQHLDLGEEAMAFIIAREMGHVIAHHHKSNVKTKMLFTVLTGVLFPAVSIISASSAAAQATTATTLMTSAASTVTSYVGSEVALSRIKPNQLTEADDISLALLEYQGLSKVEIAQSLAFIVENDDSDGWERDLNQSIQYVSSLVGNPKQATTELEPLPEAYMVAEAGTGMLAEQVKSEKPTSDNKFNQQPTLQLQHETKSTEEKSAETHKVILITNETLALNRSREAALKKQPISSVSGIKKAAKKAPLQKVAVKTKKVSKTNQNKTNVKIIKAVKPSAKKTSIIKTAKK